MRKVEMLNIKTVVLTSVIRASVNLNYVYRRSRKTSGVYLQGNMESLSKRL